MQETPANPLRLKVLTAAEHAFSIRVFGDFGRAPSVFGNHRHIGVTGVCRGTEVSKIRVAN